jgi:hypothetical protein
MIRRERGGSIEDLKLKREGEEVSIVWRKPDYVYEPITGHV